MPADRDALVSLTQDPGPFLTSDDPILRRMAVTALDEEGARSRLGKLITMAADADTAVRAAVAEKLGSCGEAALEALAALAGDDEAVVREAVSTAYGEVGNPSAIDWLVAAASSDDDRSVREACVAALGAIGDPVAVEPLLGLLADAPPPVRRRAVAALTVFDDPRIEPAIQRAAFDRNPGVREAAEMVVGRQVRAP